MQEEPNISSDPQKEQEMRAHDVHEHDLERTSGGGDFGAGVGARAGGVVGAAVGAAVAGPVGTVVGAVVGAVAGGLSGKVIVDGVDAETEEHHWKETHVGEPDPRWVEEE